MHVTEQVKQLVEVVFLVFAMLVLELQIAKQHLVALVNVVNQLHASKRILKLLLIVAVGMAADLAHQVIQVQTELLAQLVAMHLPYAWVDRLANCRYETRRWRLDAAAHIAKDRGRETEDGVDVRRRRPTLG